jgi:hypothetical protein
MDTPRVEYIDGAHMYPDRKHIYGGIYKLSMHGMIGYGINPDYLRASCKHDDILIIVVERGKSIQTTKILGCLTAIIHNSRCIEINNIGTRSHHGGIGTNLMHHLLEVSRHCGFSVCVLKSLVSAMIFYFKSGFVYLGTSKSILGEAEPVFAINLNQTIPERPHLQRQNSTELVTLDTRSLQEIEKELEPFPIPRNIPLERYIRDIGRLDEGEPWDFLYKVFHTKLGLVSNKDDVDANRLSSSALGHLPSSALGHVTRKELNLNFGDATGRSRGRSGSRGRARSGRSGSGSGSRRTKSLRPKGNVPNPVATFLNKSIRRPNKRRHTKNHTKGTKSHTIFQMV